MSSILTHCLQAFRVFKFFQPRVGDPTRGAPEHGSDAP